MYRCTECHAEYEIKPDYCECSNDVFEEIQPQVQTKKETKEDLLKVKNEVTLENKTEKAHKTKVFWTPATIILISACIILSLVILLFVGNTTQEEETKKVETASEETPIDIPNIDTFWNNTPPQIEQKQTVEAPVVKEEKPKETVVAKPQPIKQVQKLQPIQKKPITKAEKPKQQVKVAKTTQKVVSQTKATTPKQQTTATQKQPPLPSQQTTVQKQPALTLSQQIQKPAVNKQELMKYKVSLRNTIARKINFANIIGDGTCIVTFTISSSGTLENKKFKVQSDNFTLNDVVYAAIMQTPSYNPPPSAYKGETMSFTVKMFNGNFEVSLN